MNKSGEKKAAPVKPAKPAPSRKAERAQLAKQAKRKYLAKHDLKSGSKYFFCFPLNILSVRAAGATSVVAHLLEAGLAAACFTFILTYDMHKRTKPYFIAAICLDIAISALVAIVSVFLCFERLVNLWLYIRYIAPAIQLQLAAVVFGCAWAEFERVKPTNVFANYSTLHIAMFALWLVTFVISHIWADYTWRAVHCECFCLAYSLETE